MKYWQSKQNFLPTGTAQKLRAEFLSVFSDPRFSHPKRFVWDHWYLKDQYKMHRTPAEDFFSPKLYGALCNTLIQFGQDHLGCHTISKPWLSYYTEGDRQNFHTDSPHGPWAFVYSLTDWRARKFTGGRTTLFKPDLLHYWQNYFRLRGQETFDLFHKINPDFNKLVIFDPRIPHGVEEIKGVEDPRDGRLVVHGWFVPPEPFVTGGLARTNPAKLMHSLNAQIEPLVVELDLDQNARGVLILRFQISPKGKVEKIKVLTNTLIEIHGQQALIEGTVRKLIKRAHDFTLPSARARSEFTLPLSFD